LFCLTNIVYRFPSARLSYWHSRSPHARCGNSGRNDERYLSDKIKTFIYAGFVADKFALLYVSLSDYSVFIPVSVIPWMSHIHAIYYPTLPCGRAIGRRGWGIIPLPSTPHPLLRTHGWEVLLWRSATEAIAIKLKVRTRVTFDLLRCPSVAEEIAVFILPPYSSPAKGIET
jgi:hypothetical protein